ncbi:MAG: DUF1638 domain-containing protein [Holophagales bacterium]|jgi:hypothetical protein|nr:DUF1638 domain-containing protein [Holophagales bacterium]MBK9969086.1 DUF1638 domain-containing protein [Holophagales bacterium]
MGTVLVACRTIEGEVLRVASEAGFVGEVRWIESGLHNRPEVLRARLQEEIDRIDGADTVLLAFGYCGNSLVGLTARGFRLVFPRADDCITLLLGSCARRQEISSEVGTYFLTKGWLEHETNLWAEHQASVRKWGAERAERLRARMLAHYGRLAVVETGAYDLPSFVERTRPIAEALKLDHAVVPGSLRFLGKLLTGPWDEEFLSLAPGETVTVERIFGPPATTARPGGESPAAEG